MNKLLICLDRDGVVNDLVIDAEHGTIDSPLHPDQVKLCHGAIGALKNLHSLGATIVLVSNQPAAAKGKTTQANLQAVHSKVVELLAQGGVSLQGAYYCFHRAEDQCVCRKPRTGLLEQVLQAHPSFSKNSVWMVGDGVTDVQAGASFGVSTAFVAPRKSQTRGFIDSLGVQPTVYCTDLLEFSETVSSLDRENTLQEKNFSRLYFSECSEAISEMDASAVESVANGLAKVRNNGGRLFILGVGGSAGHASHAVNDFRKICQFEAYCPTDNISELTARVNDEGWETVFSEWLKGSRLTQKDALLIFSVGGGNQEKKVSVNLVRAIDLAHERGASVFGIVGRDGGYTKKMAQACVLIPTVASERVTPHTEGLCAVVWHLLVSHPALQVQATKWESLKKAS